ncbi:hypothetical protein BDY17DRAFT_203088 [Neohortaea acidophila]|uniref:Uncharacterized protein n=1 Tax=Neohortaea acidophila TaxID=245834 RepID=A0A6A6PNE5_9PEZI|nr:uncharacterized protein BDY17DRAFT_203088 [Neohortaea acidophila]KAF2480953.1 hypothetical protein BDY17DRAFT_203088 [Neohortaea acidophila]
MTSRRRTAESCKPQGEEMIPMEKVEKMASEKARQFDSGKQTTVRRSQCRLRVSSPALRTCEWREVLEVRRATGDGGDGPGARHNRACRSRDCSVGYLGRTMCVLGINAVSFSSPSLLPPLASFSSPSIISTTARGKVGVGGITAGHFAERGRGCGTTVQVRYAVGGRCGGRCGGPREEAKWRCDDESCLWEAAKELGLCK